jgi:hypothetical protein
MKYSVFMSLSLWRDIEADTPEEAKEKAMRYWGDETRCQYAPDTVELYSADEESEEEENG